MATYAIGDVQGCFQPLLRLLDIIERETPNPRLLFAGDLVNRGPQSLETVRFVRALKERAVTVLGNHDLALLAIAANAPGRRMHASLAPFFAAADCDELVDWLRFRPLAHYEQAVMLVHAGLLPQWSATQALSLAREVEAILQGDNWQSFMQVLYGDEPRQWDDHLQGMDRLRCIVNGFTRLRFCTREGSMDFDAKEGLSSAPSGYMPWFDVPARQSQAETIVFGHWSALGLMIRPQLISLDTGCVWGRQLTAVRLADRAVFQVGSLAD